MTPAAFINPGRDPAHRDPPGGRARGGGAAFRYREGIAFGGGAATLAPRYALAGALSGTQLAFAAGARAGRSTRSRVASALRAVLPAAGFGPAADRLEDWRWRMSVAARTVGGRELVVQVEADGHPGYLATARMLGEAGLILAEPDLAPGRAGCLTPAAALGTACLERFERARLRFSVDA
jgi:short subunit dehydrogenase-like uncharacterized protein